MNLNMASLLNRKTSLEFRIYRLRPAFPICLTLVLLTLVVYWQVRDFEFVLYDDTSYVSDNPHVQDGLTSKNLLWAVEAVDVSNWHPITWISHLMDVELFGMNPGAHHLTNLIVHLINSMLLFIILKRITGLTWASGFVAALFAVHPINAESVAWVSERKNLLCAFFFMISLWAYVRWVEKPCFRRYVLVTIFFILGLMAKPMLVTLPFVLLLLDFWPFERIRRINGEKERANAIRLFWEKIPLFVLSLGSSVLTFLVQRNSGAVRSFESLSFQLRMDNALISYVRYLCKLLRPLHLAVVYPYSQSIPAWQVGGALVLLVVITWISICHIKRYPYIFVGWFWFLGALVPVIGIIQVGPQAMADRYAYIPLIGLFILIAWGIREISLKSHLGKIGIVSLAGTLIAVLAVITHQQASYWKNTITLFQHAVNETSNNHIAHINLALALMEQNRLDEAIAHFNLALKIKPAFPLAHNNLGVAMGRQGRYSEAIRHYTEALRLKPDWAGALFNLGNALSALGQFEDAVKVYRRALAVSPNDAEIYNNLGNALFEKRNPDEAIDYYQQALALQPGCVSALLNSAKAYANKGEYGLARFYFRKAINFEPNNPRAYYLIAVTYAKENRISDSVQWIERAAQQGFNNWPYFRKDRNFVRVRQSSDYQKLMKRLSILESNFMSDIPDTQMESVHDQG
ncbi:MAG: tetratricopeptide repeat protein [Desulfobacteraceae bacterium]|nr:MAG: tetratricopeptide repeat protein [Desulfobacteraceae bacterium]